MPYPQYSPPKVVRLQGQYLDMPAADYIVPYSSPGQNARYSKAPIGMGGMTVPSTWTEGPYGLGADTTTSFDPMQWIKDNWQGMAAGAAVMLVVGGLGGGRRR